MNTATSKAARRAARVALTIPDAWLGGYMRLHPGESIYDAVAWWQDQARMAAEHATERATS